jgi:membrane protein
VSAATETGAHRAPSGRQHLSLREWPDVLRQTVKRFIADDCSGLAKQVAFSTLLAFLPSVILLIGLLGLFGSGAFDALERFVGSVAPHSVVSMIDLARTDAAGRTSGSAIALVAGIIAALWAASGGMGAVIKAVNRAYEEDETRPFWKVRLVALILVVATGVVTAGMFLLIVFGGSLGDAIVRRTGLGGNFKTFWDLARWPIAFAAVLLFLALVYYLAPDRKQRSWRWISAGSLVAALMWLLLSGLFSLYTGFSDSYSRTYGSLAGAILLLLWLNYSAWAILFGAELNAELDRRRSTAPRRR